VFRPVSPDADFVTIEQEVLAHWAAERIFERSVEQRRDAEPWVFYEGPPTANGRPGLHHVWARVYKDLFCRFRTMRGYQVARRAGWDTHGLPVEVEVEKRLGITGKRQIEEEVGIAEFVRLCRESVLSYVDDWLELTTRIGYWVDLSDAYWTMSPDYVQSVWWHLKSLFEQGLLYEDLKVVPYCPRCGTALSSHELGQPGVYADEEDESAYVLLPLVDADPAVTGGAAALVDADPAVTGGATALVAWTTTPWTLLANTGAAVNPELTYAVVDAKLVAEALVPAVFGEDAVITHRVTGDRLVGLRYRRPFDDVAEPLGSDGWRVVAGDFVTTAEGTGVVHLAPAFGEIDREVGRAAGLPTLNPVGPDGRFTGAVDWLAGQAVREANETINDRLAGAGLLLRRHRYRHSYPHCWRCGTALIYWGKPSWYVATSTRKSEMLAENRGIDWHPEHIRDGRFGEWLANNVDWALSRDRFWGTPLPIWRCADGHLFCVASLEELSELAGRDVRGIDPHRPAIDEVEFDCPDCAAGGGGGEGDHRARRVEPVIDAWFDSGSMPAAQVGYPLTPGSTERFEFPADFISEAIDQTRGWFYSLLAVNTLVFGSAPYRHVVCLGHIVDAEGHKMSKSVGNVIDPWEILDSRGADPLRWWMFSQGSPWTPTRASLQAIDTAMREMLLTLWNAFSFFTNYASLNGFDPADPAVPPVSERPALDRWILSRLASTLGAVTDALDGYEPLPAAGAIGTLVDDLSNWYVRRSRRRFWRTDPDAPPSDGLAAHATLHEVLTTLSVMIAPMCPFVGDRMWRELTGAAEGESVHLADWPDADVTAGGAAGRIDADVTAGGAGGRIDADVTAGGAGSRIDADLEAQMELARRLSSLGRAARSEARVRVRQPLARALVFVPAGAPALIPGLVEDELNVDQVVVATELDEVLQFELVPNFGELGPRLKAGVKDLKPALAALDGAAAAAALESGGTVRVELPSGPIDLGPGDLELRVRGQPGFAVSRDGGEVVALDLTLDDDLRRRGLAREVVRHVQDLRKSSGLEVSDRITLVLSGLDDLTAHFDAIGREVLATSVSSGEGDGDGDGDGEGSVIELDDRPPAIAWIQRA
jgi:isoleucyl-tRNA synthetase